MADLSSAPSRAIAIATVHLEDLEVRGMDSKDRDNVGAADGDRKSGHTTMSSRNAGGMLREALAGAEELLGDGVTGAGATGRGACRAENAEAENAPDRKASFPARDARPAAVRGSREADSIRCT